MQDGSVCGFKYLQFTGEEQEIAVTYRGEFTGKILIYTEETRKNQIAEIQISPAKDWHRKKKNLNGSVENVDYTLSFVAREVVISIAFL